MGPSWLIGTGFIAEHTRYYLSVWWQTKFHKPAWRYHNGPWWQVLCRRWNSRKCAIYTRFRWGTQELLMVDFASWCLDKVIYRSLVMQTSIHDMHELYISLLIVWKLQATTCRHVPDISYPWTSFSCVWLKGLVYKRVWKKLVPKMQQSIACQWYWVWYHHYFDSY